jgi:hypothetical protein
LRVSRDVNLVSLVLVSRYSFQVFIRVYIVDDSLFGLQNLLPLKELPVTACMPLPLH